MREPPASTPNPYLSGWAYPQVSNCDVRSVAVGNF